MEKVINVFLSIPYGKTPEERVYWKTLSSAIAAWLLAICFISSFGGCHKKPGSGKSALLMNMRVFGLEWDGNAWSDPDGTRLYRPKTSIKGKVIEECDLWWHYHLEELQFYSYSPLPDEESGIGNLALALRLDDGLVHYFWLPKVKRIDKVRTGKYQVTMIDGRLFTGEWVTSRPSGYSHEIQEERLEGLIMQDKKSIPV